MKLKIDCIQATNLPDAEKTALKITIGSETINADKYQKTGKDELSFSAVINLDIDGDNYENGKLQIEIEAWSSSGPSAGNMNLVGTGKGSLKTMIPSINNTVYFIVDVIQLSRDNRGNVRKSEVMMRGSLHDPEALLDDLRSKSIELDTLRKSFDEYIKSTKDLEGGFEEQLARQDAKVQRLAGSNARLEAELAEQEQRHLDVGQELLQLKLQNDESKKANTTALSIINEELTEKLKTLNAENEVLKHRLRNAEEDIVVLQSDHDELYSAKYESELKLNDEIAELKAELEQQNGRQNQLTIVELNEKILLMSKELNQLRASSVSNRINIKSTFISNSSISIENNYYETIINSTTSNNTYITNILQSGDSEMLKTELIKQLERYESLKITNSRLLGKVQSMQGNMQVCLRARPPNEEELTRGGNLCVDAGDTSEVAVYDSESTTWKAFNFDRVFDYDATQLDLFAEVEPMIASVSDGFNASILLYGQTSSGKTFTSNGFGPHVGISFRAMQKLFELLDLKKSQAEKLSKQIRETQASGAAANEASFQYSVQITVIEVCLDQVMDLLNPNGPQQISGITVDKNGAVELSGVTKLTSSNANEAINKLFGPLTARNAASERNSKSTTLVTVTVMSDNGVDPPLKRHMQIADLVGSEHLATGDVNLVALHAVMAALENKTPVPYDSSVLTTILRNSLGGNSKTMMIMTVSPTDLTVSQTLNTLEFGKKVRGVKVEPIRKNDSGNKDLEYSIKSLNMELKRAKAGQEKAEASLVDSKQATQAMIVQLNVDYAELQNSLDEEKQQKQAAQMDISLLMKKLSRCLEELKKQDDVNSRLHGILTKYESAFREAELLKNGTVH